MSSFSELMQEKAEDWKRTTGGSSLLGSYTDDDRLISEVVTAFFDKHGFHNLEYLGQGSSAIILKDVDNPALVFRIAPTYSIDTRALIPQVLQPIHVERVGRLKIEVLPNVSIPDELPDQEFADLLTQFKNEVRQSGHHLDSDSPQFDVGLFRYEDAKKPGTYKQAFLAADASLIPPKETAVPACSEDFPSLQDQWREQCKMVNQDQRLKKLLGGLPAKLPSTKTISTDGHRK